MRILKVNPQLMLAFNFAVNYNYGNKHQTLKTKAAKKIKIHQSQLANMTFGFFALFPEASTMIMVVVKIKAVCQVLNFRVYLLLKSTLMTALQFQIQIQLLLLIIILDYDSIRVESHGIYQKLFKI